MSNLSGYLKEIVIAVLVLIVISFITYGTHIIPFIIPFMKYPETIPLYVILIFEGYMTLVSALWIFEPLAIINSGKNGKISPWIFFFVRIAIVLAFDFISPLITSLVDLVIILIVISVVREKKIKYDREQAGRQLFIKAFNEKYKGELPPRIQKLINEIKEKRGIKDNKEITYIRVNKGISPNIENNENFVLRCAKCNSRLDPASKYCPSCKEVIDETNIMVSRIRM